MIATLRGTVLEKGNGSAVLECGGIGFRCFVTRTTEQQLPPVGQQAFLYTQLNVREEAMDLFGFSSKAEQETFKLVTSVSGVGAKIGLALLSQFNPETILLCVAGGDAKTLTAATGVGLKLAQRIVLELKDKVGSLSAEQGFSSVQTVGNAVGVPSSREAIEALTALGYSQSEASLAVGRLDPSLPTDDLIRGALKQLARGL